MLNLNLLPDYFHPDNPFYENGVYTPPCDDSYIKKDFIACVKNPKNGVNELVKVNVSIISRSVYNGAFPVGSIIDIVYSDVKTKYGAPLTGDEYRDFLTQQKEILRSRFPDWLLCDGSRYEPTMYVELYSLMERPYLPNLDRAVCIGKDWEVGNVWGTDGVMSQYPESKVVGNYLGFRHKRLTVNELLNHSHSYSDRTSFFSMEASHGHDGWRIHRNLYTEIRATDMPITLIGSNAIEYVDLKNTLTYGRFFEASQPFIKSLKIIKVR